MSLSVTKTNLPGVLIIEPKVYGDSRGFFFESFNAESFRASTGVRLLLYKTIIADRRTEYYGGFIIKYNNLKES